MKAGKGDTVIFNKCVKKEQSVGIVEAVYGKGTDGESYMVKAADGSTVTVSPKDVEHSMLTIRAKKSSKPKTKSNGRK